MFLNISDDWVRVLSSVLQDSVLGGILFNIFVDDIDEAFRDLLTLIFEICRRHQAGQNHQEHQGCDADAKEFGRSFPMGREMENEFQRQEVQGHTLQEEKHQL